MTPQCATLLKHFKVKPTISPAEAETVYRIRRLAARIYDLEKKGYQFQREVRKDPTGQRYVRYTYLQPKALPVPAGLQAVA